MKLEQDGMTMTTTPKFIVNVEVHPYQFKGTQAVSVVFTRISVLRVGANLQKTLTRVCRPARDLTGSTHVANLFLERLNEKVAYSDRCQNKV